MYSGTPLPKSANIRRAHVPTFSIRANIGFLLQENPGYFESVDTNTVSTYSSMFYGLRALPNTDSDILSSS